MRAAIAAYARQLNQQEGERAKRIAASETLRLRRLAGFEETLSRLLADAKWMFRYRLEIPSWALRNPFSLEHREWIAEFDLAEIGAPPDPRLHTPLHHYF